MPAALEFQIWNGNWSAVCSTGAIYKFNGDTLDEQYFYLNDMAGMMSTGNAAVVEAQLIYQLDLGPEPDLAAVMTNLFGSNNVLYYADAEVYACEGMDYIIAELQPAGEALLALLA